MNREELLKHNIDMFWLATKTEHDKNYFIEEYTDLQITVSRLVKVVQEMSDVQNRLVKVVSKIAE